MSDDITTLRAVRPRVDAPSAAVRAAAYAALMERAALTVPTPERARRVRLPRMGLRFAVAGGLAGAVAAAAIAAYGLGGADENGRPRSVPPSLPGLPGLPGAPVASAQAALYQAADHAGSRAFTPPRPGQWTYLETRYTSPGKPALGTTQTPKSPLKTRVDRAWTRIDGTRTAFYDHGKLITVATGGAMPPVDYASVVKIPLDPDALIAWAQQGAPPARTAGERDGEAFRMLASLLNNNLVPPRQEAAVYRAMAKIPGVTLDQKTVDVAGRPALAVSRVIEGYLRQEVLLDRASYAYLGERSVVTKDHTGDGGTGDHGTWTVKKGTVDVFSVRVAAAFVDQPGQRP
jgi:hypothetical protein